MLIRKLEIRSYHRKHNSIIRKWEKVYRSEQVNSSRAVNIIIVKLGALFKDELFLEISTTQQDTAMNKTHNVSVVVFLTICAFSTWRRSWELRKSLLSSTCFHAKVCAYFYIRIFVSNSTLFRYFTLNFDMNTKFAMNWVWVLSFHIINLTSSLCVESGAKCEQHEEGWQWTLRQILNFSYIFKFRENLSSLLQ